METQTIKQNRDKIRKIGGCVYDVYSHLQRYVDKINDGVLSLWKLANIPTDIPLFIEAYFNGDKVIKDRYLEVEFARFVDRLKANDPEATERYAKYKGSAMRPHNADMQIKKQINKRFQELRAGKRIRFEQSCLSKSVLMVHFENALLFDSDKGLYIDADLFLQIYTDIAKGKESDKHKQHEDAAKAMNAFFGRCPVTFEEIQRYFIIYAGRLEINPKTENLQSYVRLI